MSLKTSGFRQPSRRDTIDAMTHRRIWLIVLAGLLTGCTRARTFQVAVRNETDRPVTVGFAKEEGGPFEPA